MKESQTVEELIQLRAQIDQELHQRMRQTLCLMLADVVGSTTFYQQHGDVQGRLFIQRHHDTLSPLIVKRHGRVIKTMGDGIMAVFDEPTDGLECALAIQQALQDKRSQGPEDMTPQTKVSLHYGSALVETHDIYGDLVNTSARLIGMAEPEQILISQSVYEVIKDRTARPILPLPARAWKEGERSVPVYEVLWQNPSETEAKQGPLRKFNSTYQACFYCGLREHEVTQCPSKQRTGHTRWLNHLGYLPLSEILALFQQADLNAVVDAPSKGHNIYEAFYEISLPYQLRFLIKVWLATSENWSSLERQQATTAHSLAGTRLWMGLDSLRVGRYEQAKTLLQSAIESNPQDYKSYVVLGLIAVEKADLHRALQHWQKALMLTKSTLQTAYIHLLIHRLYASYGKPSYAAQELHKALNRDPYLHEATYRHLALLVGSEREGEVLTRLRKLIQDDRSIYLKVLLDPAFAPLRERLYPLLSTLCQETRTEALQRIRDLTEAISALRAWYPRPGGDFVSIENALDRLRQHIKSDSYFGYHDAVNESDTLQHNIQRALGQRKTALQRDYATTLVMLQTQLNHTAHDPKQASRLSTLKQELNRLRALKSLSTAEEFWPAWEDMQKLKTAVQDLTAPTSWRQGLLTRRRLLSLSLFGLSGSIIVSTGLFALFGYLTYSSGWRLPHGTLILILSLGAVAGLLLGGGVGLLLQRYRHQR